MRKSRTKKLDLNTRTLAVLTTEDLRNVDGGTGSGIPTRCSCGCEASNVA